MTIIPFEKYASDPKRVRKKPPDPDETMGVVISLPHLDLDEIMELMSAFAEIGMTQNTMHDTPIIGPP